MSARPLPVAVLIGLATLVLVLVLSLLNHLVKRLQAHQMAHLWNERQRWRDPSPRPRSGHERSHLDSDK
jgi:hypothetical protein